MIDAVVQANPEAGRGGNVPPVEHRFKSSGNPAGQPKGTKLVKKRLRNALIRHLKANPDMIPAIVAAVVEEARTRPETIVEREGNSSTTTIKGQAFAQAQKIVWDRLDGLLTSKAQADINVNVTHTKRIVFEDQSRLNGRNG